MKTSVLIILTVTVLIVGALAVMNNACKISQASTGSATSSQRIKTAASP
jgi:Flp pilus assembly protein CpaB